MTTATEPDSRARPPVGRVAWDLMKVEPRASALGWIEWIVFHSFPVVTGLVLKAILDRVGGTDPVWGLLAVLAGLEIGRWALLVANVWQYSGVFIGWQTVPRVNLLRSLLCAPGPAEGRLPGSSGEAVSRFRDDVQDVTIMVDSWIDVAGSAVAAGLAVGVLVAIDWRITVLVVLPVIAALAFAHWLGPRLKAWRETSRLATAGVTALLADVFGAHETLLASGAKEHALERLAERNARRAHAARLDQVGTALVQSLGSATGELAIGLALLVAAPALSRGELTVGDIGLLASYVSIIAALPRWAGRLGATHRQSEVAVHRLAELTPDGDPVAPVAMTSLPLRHGPGVYQPTGLGPAPAAPLEVRGLQARAAAGAPLIGPVDLVVEPGALVVLTGPVGCGKTTILRAIVGLVGRESGNIAWGGQPVEDPSVVLVPPVAAYVPQVPHLCSEPLADAVLLGLPVDRLADALALAQLTDEVAAMPDGAATTVGPRGVRLSGGQAQRTATARALARRPALLVVDDVSSALDVETEARLWDALAAGGMTALVVSTRPAVLARADTVVSLHSRV